MYVLDRVISNKVELIMKTIMERLPKPIIFMDLKNQKGCFGKCGQDSNSFFVWLNVSLPDDAFETNLIHELIHLTQMLKNIPDARPINDSAEGEREFAQILNSLILDIEVEEKLKSYGLDSSYFSNERLKQMKQIRNDGFAGYANNDFLQKYSAIRLALYSYTARPGISDKMFSCFSKRYPRICSIAIKIRQTIEGRTFEDTDEMFAVMKKNIEILDIGTHIKIVYNEKTYIYFDELKQWQIMIA